MCSWLPALARQSCPCFPGNIDDYGRGIGASAGTVIAEEVSTPFDDPTAIYDKGARVLHMLRRLVGDEVFFAATRSYLDQFGGGSATTEDLQDVFETECGEDLDWFFAQWVYQSESPRLVTWHRDYSDGGSPRVAIYVKQVQQHHLYRLPIDVVVDGQRQREWVDGENNLTVIELPAESQPSVVTLDPDGDLMVLVADLGRSNLTDIPVVAAAASRYSGLAPFDVTLTATSPQSLAGYTVKWAAYFESSAAVHLQGESATLRVAPAEFSRASSSAWVYLELTSPSSDTIWYPVPLAIYAYDPDHPDVAAARAGDLFADGIVDGVDLAIAASYLGELVWDGPFRGDLDDDGVIDEDDLRIIASRLGRVPPPSRRRAQSAPPAGRPSASPSGVRPGRPR